MNYRTEYDKVVKQIDMYYIMTCSPPRLLKYKKRFQMIDKDMFIVLAEDDGDFLIYSNEEHKDIIASLVLPKYKVPLLFDLVSGFEGVCCLCESLKFLKSYHLQQASVLRRIINDSETVYSSDDDDSTLSDI